MRQIEAIARSRDGLRRIEQIVKNLRDFARLDESDLNAGIRTTANVMASKATEKDVTVELNLVL